MRVAGTRLAERAAAVSLWLQPHRIGLIAAAAVIVVSAAVFMRWEWLPDYYGLALRGIWNTLWILVVSIALGLACAVPLGLAQAAGPAWLAWPAYAFCTLIRGTPLLLQLWLLYYGLGSLFPAISVDPPVRAVADPEAGLALCAAVADDLLRGL